MEVINGSLHYLYNTRWRGLAELLILVERAMRRPRMWDKRQKVSPAPFLFPHTLSLTAEAGGAGRHRKNECIMPLLFNNGELLIPLRQNYCLLDSGQLKKFYDTLLFCENDVSTMKYFKINSVEIKELKKEMSFDIEPTKDKSISIYRKIDTIYYCLINKKASIPSLFEHIRNAFAHNRIVEIGENDYLVYDVIPASKKVRKANPNKKYSRITMYTRVSSLSKLLKIIEEIRKTQR